MPLPKGKYPNLTGTLAIASKTLVTSKRNIKQQDRKNEKRRESPQKLAKIDYKNKKKLDNKEDNKGNKGDKGDNKDVKKQKNEIVVKEEDKKGEIVKLTETAKSNENENQKNK